MLPEIGKNRPTSEHDFGDVKVCVCHETQCQDITTTNVSTGTLFLCVGNSS